VTAAWMLAAAVAALCPSGAAAAAGSDDGPARGEGPPSFLYLSGELDDLSPGGGGGSGGVLWTRGLSRRFTAEAGGFAHSLDGTRWAYARLGGTMAASDAAIVHLEANLGGGTRTGSGIPYRTFRGGLTLELAPRRLWADLDSQYIRFAESNGNILKLGGIVAPRPSLSLRAAYYVSTGGNLGARYLATRADLQHRRLGLFAGLSLGRSRPELFNFFSSSTTVNSTQLYGGARVPARRHEITAYVDSVDSGGVRRTGLAVVLKLRL